MILISTDTFKLAYRPVPKIATTSVKAALAKIDPEISTQNKTAAEIAKQSHELYPTRRFGQARWHLAKGFWRFAIVRDPLSRLLSLYTNRVVASNDLRNSAQLKKVGTLPIEPDPDYFFQNLSAYSEQVWNIRHHALPEVKFLGPDLSKFDKVYPINALPQLATDLSEKSGHDVKIPSSNSSSEKLDFGSLKPATQDDLKAMLEPRYDYLGAYYTSPFSC